MSFLLPSPTDISAFVDAQNQLRDSLGTTVSFGVPQTAEWAAGTAINPDTGAPFDSTLVPSNAEFVYTDVTVLIIEKEGSPLRPQADAGSFNPSGLREGVDIILDVATDDYQTVVSQATVFTADGIDYALVEAKPFSMGASIYRYLIYGEAQ
jgi:hypothetical protein